MKNDNSGVNIVQKLQPNLNVKFHADQSSNKQIYRVQPPDQQFQQGQMQENSRLQTQIKDQQFKQDSRQNPGFYQNNQQQLTYGDNRQSQGYVVNNNRPPQLYPPDNRFSQPSQGDNRNSQQNYHNAGPPPMGSSHMIPGDHQQSLLHQEMQTSQFNYQQNPMRQPNCNPQSYAESRPPQQSGFGSNQVQNPVGVQYQQSTYQPTTSQVDNQQTHQNTYFGENRPSGYALDNRDSSQPMHPENRQSQTVFHCDNRPPQEYVPDSRQQFYPLTNERVGQQGYPRPPQAFPPDNRQPQTPMVQGYPQNDNRLQPGRQCPPDNRQYQQDYFQDGRQPSQQHNYFENHPPQQNYPPDRPGQPYYQDDRPQPVFPDNQPQPGYSRVLPTPDTRRLNQPLQTYQNQNSPQRQLPNVGYQREVHRSGYREQSESQDRRQQIIPHAEFSNPMGHQIRRQLPDRQDSLPVDQSSRKRFPLRKYNSEEQYSSIQDEYERQHGGSAQADNQEAQYARGGNRHQRAKSKGPRQRSLSLDSQERGGDHYHSKLRTSSQERSREEDEYDSPPERYVTESKRMVHRSTSGSGSSSKATQRSPVSSTGKQGVADRNRKSNTWLDRDNIEETRLAERRQGTVSKESKRLTVQSQRSRPSPEVQKGENYCPQHKKFTSATTTNSSRPVRRLLPKEPQGSSVLRKNIRTQVSYTYVM